MTNAPQKKRAAIHSNRDFVCIQTYSGYGSARIDPAGARIFLTEESSAESLGTALQEALSKSRIVKPEEIEEFLTPELTAKTYEEWVAQVMQRFRYSKRRDMFKGMKYCAVVCEEGSISVRPSKRAKGELWLGLGRDEHVQVADTASPDAIGSAVQIALNRCPT